MWHIRDLGVDYYIILAGDQLYKMDYRHLVRTHFQKDADITVSALPVDRESAKSFGVMKVKNNGRIAEFVEKPQEKSVLDAYVTPEKVFEDFGLESAGKPYLGSMGVYLFKADVLESLLFDNPQWDDFGREIIPNALKSHKVFAHMFPDFWEDIGTVRSYFDVSMALTSPNPPFHFHDPYYPTHTHLRALPGVRVEDASVKHSILCEGSRISKATIANSIIGIRSIVNPGAKIESSVILGADQFEYETPTEYRKPIGIGANAHIKRAIIDHNARIGKNVAIKGSKRLKDQDGDGYCIREGIVIVLKNAVIPDGTQIG